MPQKKAFKAAIETIASKYTYLLKNFTCEDFLKSSIDPFRFSFNEGVWGLHETVKKEIEHKIEMKLEDLFGDFHENYLGNCIHEPTDTSWEIIPPGIIPGVDIANKELGFYLQIKSKHNSMNSSSAKRLANELGTLSQQHPEWHVGCGWVIANNKRKAIGENNILKVANTHKGKELFAFVTGNENEMDELIEQFPILLKDFIAEDYEKLLSKATDRVIKELETRANLMNIDVRGYIYHHATS